VRRPALDTVVVLALTLLPLLGVGTALLEASAPMAGPPARSAGARVAEAGPAALGSLGGNWSTYLQSPGRTGANLLERTLSPSNASQLAIRWTVKTSGSDFSSPTVVNGTVYAGSWNGYEYALNASNGSVVWKTFLGTDPNCSWGSPMGVAGAATVWNGTVYVGGGNDYWYALSAANGSVEWKIKVIDDSPSGGAYNWASPLLADGAEYIGIASCIDSPLVQGKILMVNLSGNHSILHTFDTVPNGQIGATIWTTSAYDAGSNTVWVATGNDDGSTSQKLAQSILALNASTLTLLGSWEVPGVNGSDSDFGGGPILFHDASGRLLVGAENKNGVFYALNRSNVTTNGSWKPVWEDASASGFSPAAFDGTTLYLGCGSAVINGTSFSGSVQALNPSNGSVLWTQGTDGMVYGGLAYANGLVFEGSGTTEEVLDASTGAILSTLSVPSGQYIDGAPSVADGQVFFESGDDSTNGAFLAAGIPFHAGLTSGPTNGSAPWPVQFHGMPTGGAPPYNFTWTFGDGTTSYASSPLHSFAAGIFNTSVAIRDSANHSGSANVTVAVTNPLTAGISSSPRAGPAPWNVSFVGSAAYGSGPPYTYSWSFGDGSPNATGVSVRHEFATPGSFPVKLTVSDSIGRTANSTVVVTVSGAFAAALVSNVSSGTAPLTVGFMATGTNGTAPYTFDWSFGDSTPNASGASVSHTYVRAGAYTATLTATDSAGVQRVRTSSITVAAAPVPLATALSLSNRTAGCPSPSWVTEGVAQASGGTPPYVDSWSFGDGSGTVVGAFVNHTFARSGTYTVTLTTTDGNLTTASASERISVTIATCGPASHPGVSVPPSEVFPIWLGVALAAAVVVLILSFVLVAWRRRRRS